MAYSRTFNPEKYSQISEHLARLETLEPGQRLRLSGFTNLDELERAKWLIYDWLHHMSLKPLFRVLTDYDQRELLLKRLGISPLRQTVEVPLDQAQEALLKQLILSDEPEATLRQWVSTGKVGIKEALDLERALARTLR